MNNWLCMLSSIALTCAQPQHQAAQIDVAAMYTFAGGLDLPEQEHYNRPFWRDGQSVGWHGAMTIYIDSNVTPDLEAGADRVVWVKAYGMEEVSADAEDEWKIVGWRDSEPVRSRAQGPSETDPVIAEAITAGLASVAPQTEETVVYIGLPPADAPPSVWTTWCSPLLDIPNVSIGLDSLGACEATNPDGTPNAGYELAKLLRHLGVTVYAEPTMPYGETEHLKELGVRWCAIDNRYAASIMQGERWDRPRELGPLLVLLQGADRFEELEAFRSNPPMHGDLTFALSTRGMTADARANLFGGSP